MPKGLQSGSMGDTIIVDSCRTTKGQLAEAQATEPQLSPHKEEPSSKSKKSHQSKTAAESTPRRLTRSATKAALAALHTSTPTAANEATDTERTTQKRHRKSSSDDEIEQITEASSSEPTDLITLRPCGPGRPVKRTKPATGLSLSQDESKGVVSKTESPDQSSGPTTRALTPQSPPSLSKDKHRAVYDPAGPSSEPHLQPQSQLQPQPQPPLPSIHHLINPPSIGPMGQTHAAAPPSFTYNSQWLPRLERDLENVVISGFDCLATLRQQSAEDLLKRVAKGHERVFLAAFEKLAKDDELAHRVVTVAYRVISEASGHS